MKLICQNCNVQYEKIKYLKSHVRSYKHKQEVAKLFQTAVHKGPVYFPMFIFLDYLRNPNQTDPIIGFEMVTMFITPEKIGALYLCHVCEKALSTADVVEHLCSVQHYFNYFASTNPELLRFAWLSDAFSYLQSHATKEYNTKGPGSLRVYDLAKMVMRKCKKLHYHQVMAVLSKTDKLMEHIQAGIPQRKSIQEYITDPARANPLLGLNLFIEYSCPKNKGYCGYLCIVCKKNISANQSISHCISFDHIYWYLKAAHPTTLVSPKSSYSNYSTKFQKEILNLAKQAQTVCPPTEIQTTHVDLECFKVVKTSSFANALEKLKEIVKEKNLSELNVSITPGKRIMLAPENHESPASTTTTEASAKQPEEKVQKGPATKDSKDDPPCKVMCVECDKTLDYIINYKGHIKGKQHKQKLTEIFGPGQYSGAIPQIKLYQYMWNRHGKQSSRPVIGLSLVTVFIHRQSVGINVPFYICHACELNIPVSSASIHLTSTQHYFNVFSYSKPDFVFLGSRNLDHFAQEEERRQGKQNMVLHVCELPGQLFTDLRILAYDKIMEKIGVHFATLRKSVQVEKRVTVQSYLKSCERKSPLLGLQFVVKCTTSKHHYFRCIYVCLLCEKMLPERHAIAHLLSFPHIFAYLDMAHHGSLSKEDSEKVALIMDLAQQAEKITANMSLREVDLSFGTFNEIEKNSFKAAVNVLQVAFRSKCLGELKPPAVPGAKLISSFEKNKESNSSECEKQGHTSSNMEKLNTDEANTNATMPKTEENGGSECPDLLHTKHKELQKTTCITSTHIQPAEPSLAPTQSDSPASETLIPSLDKLKSEPQKLDQKSLNQQELPDPISMEDPPTVQQSQPQDSDGPEQQNAELVQKLVEQEEALQKPALTETPAVPQIRSSTCTDLRSYLKMPNRPPVIGLKSVIECCSAGQQPFYMCSTCAERCEESSIINHLLSNSHRLQYLESVGYSPEAGKSKVMSSWVLTQADVVEKMQGCGEPMAVTLDAKDYHEISSEPIMTALGKLRNSLHKLISESSAQNPKAACSDNDKSDESHGPETFKRVRESKEKNSPSSDLKEILESTEPDTSKQDDHARSSKDLWTYLTSSTRKEPVIGLSMVTEYRNQNGLNSFLCSCCKVILATSSYPGHLISPRHRFNYIKIKYPEFVAHWKAEVSLTDNIKELQKKAQVVQDTEGWGCLKIVEKENKQLQKRNQDPSEDTENETLAKMKKQEPSNTTDAEKSAEAPKLELPQTGGDAAEPQDQNSNEPKLEKQQQKKKVTKRNAVIGLNFVTCVHHGKKKLFFCELCSVRGDLDHMSSVFHRKTYVKHKYPDWNASGPNMEKKLHKISLRLAAVERSTGRGMKKLKVTANVFTALSTAPLDEALRQLKLLQTKPEDGVDLKTLPSHNEPSTFSDHEQGTCNNSVDHLKSSATTANSLQQEESMLLENHLIPAPVYEPISPPPASDCKGVPSVAPSYSATHLTFFKLSNNLDCKEPLDVAHHETSPGAVTSHAESRGAGGLDGLEHSPSAFPCSPLCGHFTCCQSILKEENKLLLDNVPLKTYCFPNLPTVVGQSNASIFLSVKGLSNKDPILGLANILECQAILQPTFFLCLNCAEKVSRENFCHHMTSERHKHLTIRTQYHEIFHQWQMTPQLNIRDFAEKLALTENGLDAKIIKLTKTQYESLCSADFNDAIVILQRMYGPCLDKSSQPSHLRVQNQESNEISTVKLASRSVEAAEEKDDPPQQSCDKTTQNQEHDSGHVPLKEFDHAQGNLGRKTTTCTSTENQPQTECQNPPQTLPESDAQTAKPVVQIDLTTESDNRKSPLHTPKRITERAKEKHGIDCSNSTALETLQTAAVDVQERRQAPTFPCTATIKQEKTGHDEDSCGVDITLTLEAKSSKEPTGNIFKHNDLRYINKNRTEADAVVGLSAMIECRCEGEASLYLCVSCSSKLNHDLIRYHLLKYRHRYSYLKRRYPSLFVDWSDSDSIPERSMRLMRLAHRVEMTNEDEPGQLQVMKMNCDELNEIKAMSYDKAITHLQKIRKEQNLCGLKTCISPKITEKLIKQERMETNVTTQYSSQLPEWIAQESGRAFKRRAIEQDLPHRSFPGKKQASDVPSNHMNQSPPVGNNPEPSDFPAKRSKISGNESHSVTQLQTESSVSTTINANCTPATVPETSRSSPRSFVPSSKTYNGSVSMEKSLLKNSDEKESSSSIIAPQQKHSCPNASTINAILPAKGLEIARLSEKRPSAKKSLSENVWNYENRQFSPEKNSMTNTNPVPDSSTEMVAMKKQCIAYPVHNYNQALNPHYNWEIPSKNPDPNLTNLHLSMVSGYGTPPSATSQLTPDYVVSSLYPMYMHPGYPSVSNTMAPEYLGPVEQKAINYQSAAQCISTNGTYSANTNSAQTLHTVDQAQQVYQQIQAIQDPATCQAYYAWYSYNRTLHTNQTAADNGNATSTPAFEHGVYPLFSWPQKKN